MIPEVIRVAGARASGAGYQNAEQNMRILRELGGYQLRDLGWVLPEHLHLWKLRQARGFTKYLQVMRILALNVASAIMVMVDWKHRSQPVYVPYPAVFMLWLMSWLPRRFRPKLIADAYISIWDAQFKDRGHAEASLVARLVKRFESRAMKAATVVLTDTQANRSLMVDELGIEAARVRAWPLAIDEGRFLAKAAADAGKKDFTVLFVGTLIPLHGVEKILSAAKLIGPASGVHFRLIGDGQLGPMVEQFLVQHPGLPLTWIRTWQGLDSLAEEIACADLCLGVFGGEAKAARVLPFKLYMYLASGKAIITQAMLSTPDGVPTPPAMFVDPVEDCGIASAIRDLIAAPARVADLELQARHYYDEFLAGTCILKRWEQLRGELG